MKINEATAINIDDLSIEELDQLMTKCAHRRNHLENEARRELYNNFINAYRTFRQNCPEVSKWYDDELETSDAGVRYVEFDLYEIMDKAFL